MTRSRGGTLIELVVVVAIVGLLCAIVVAVVQQTRASARQTDCMNRLRQIGIAIHAYSSRHSVLPPGSMRSPRSPEEQGGPWAIQLYLLPDLGGKNLYNSINISRSWTSSANSTASRASPDVYVCPNDHPVRGARFGFTNYSASYGSGLFPPGMDAVVTDGFYADGLFIGKVLRPADVTDGLSHTAAFSEMVHGGAPSDPNLPPHAPRGIIYSIVPVQPPTQTRLLELCERIPGVPHGREPAGTPWYRPDYPYTHLVQPNRRACFGGDIGAGFSPITASSRHPGGVNVLFGDGRVQFVDENIELTVWRALGSRNGSEPTPGY